MEWAAIAAIAASVIGSVVNFFSTKSTNDKNAELMREQNEFNASQVDKQNAYNSPSAQVERVKAAGLNPSFFFGSGSGIENTQSSAASGSGLPSLVAPQVDSVSVARSLFDQKRLQNETLKNEADIRESFEKSESYKIANTQAEERFQLEKNKLLSDTKLSDAERHLKETQLETEKLHQQEVFYNAENLRYNLSLIEEKKNTEKWTQAHYEAVINRMVHLTPFEAQNLASQSNLNIEQSKVAAETLNKIQQEVVNMVKQGNQIDAVTLGQVIRNEVDNVKAKNEISSALLQGDSDVINLIWSNCNGILGDIIKAISSFGVAPYSGSSREKHLERTSLARSQSSWLFGD